MNSTTGTDGTATKKGQLIKGDIKCTGCILSANSDGIDVKLVGWDIWEHWNSMEALKNTWGAYHPYIQTSRLLWAIYQCIPSTTVFYYVDQNELTGK